MNSAENWKPSSVLKLTRGRAPCSAIVHDDRILVLGDNTDSGEIVSVSQDRDQLPRLPSARSSNLGVVVGGRHLYMVGPQPNSATGATHWVMYQSDLASHLNSTLTRVVNFFFSSFWKPITTLPYNGMALAVMNNGGNCTSILAVGGWQMVRSTKSSWFGISSPTATPLPYVQQLDLTSRQWSPLSDLNTARRDHAVLEISGCVVVIGGKDSRDKSLATVECFDYGRGDRTWRDAPPLSISRHSFGATVVGSCLVVAGGYRNGARLASVEYLDWHDLGAGWRRLPNMMLPRSDCGLCFYETQLVVTGGYTGLGWLALDTTETLPILPESALNPNVVVAGEVFDVGSASFASASVLEVLPPPERDHPISVATAHPAATLAAPAFQDDLPPPFLPQPSAPMAEEEEEDNYQKCSMVPAAIQTGDTDSSCPVCMDKPKQIAFLCGHQACLQCAPLFEECHTCRLPIEGRIRLYG